MSIMTHRTGTPVAGRHAAPVTFDGPRIPADTVAFVIGEHDDPDQIRAFWVRSDNSSHLEIEGGDLPAGTALAVRMDQLPMLAALLREMPNMALAAPITKDDRVTWTDRDGRTQTGRVEAIETWRSTGPEACVGTDTDGLTKVTTIIDVDRLHHLGGAA